MLCNCHVNELYDQVYTFTHDRWEDDQIIDFEFPVSDTAKAYDLFLQIRNSGSYSFSNVWLFVETYAPNGSSLRDTVEIILTDNAGCWLGKGIGNVNEMQVSFKQNVYFLHRGIYKVTIQHAMRDSTLLGILDIGLRLQYHK
ncbi:Gliding motility lipoprotein GldH [subsurface metagenome]